MKKFLKFKMFKLIGALVLTFSFSTCCFAMEDINVNQKQASSENVDEFSYDRFCEINRQGNVVNSKDTDQETKAGILEDFSRLVKLKNGKADYMSRRFIDFERWQSLNIEFVKKQYNEEINKLCTWWYDRYADNLKDKEQLVEDLEIENRPEWKDSIARKKKEIEILKKGTKLIKDRVVFKKIYSFTLDRVAGDAVEVMGKLIDILGNKIEVLNKIKDESKSDKKVFIDKLNRYYYDHIESDKDHWLSYVLSIDGLFFAKLKASVKVLDEIIERVETHPEEYKDSVDDSYIKTSLDFSLESLKSTKSYIVDILREYQKLVGLFMKISGLVVDCYDLCGLEEKGSPIVFFDRLFCIFIGRRLRDIFKDYVGGSDWKLSTMGRLKNFKIADSEFEKLSIGGSTCFRVRVPFRGLSYVVDKYHLLGEIIKSSFNENLKKYEKYYKKYEKSGFDLDNFGDGGNIGNASAGDEKSVK